MFSVKKKMKPVAKVLNHRLLHLHIIIARTVGVVNDGFRKRCNDWSVIMYNLVNSRLWSSFWQMTDPRIVSIFLYLQYLKTLFYCIPMCFLNFLVLFSAKFTKERLNYLLLVFFKKLLHTICLVFIHCNRLSQKPRSRKKF